MCISGTAPQMELKLIGFLEKSARYREERQAATANPGP